MLIPNVLSQLVDMKSVIKKSVRPPLPLFSIAFFSFKYFRPTLFQWERVLHYEAVIKRQEGHSQFTLLSLYHLASEGKICT